jgi:peptidoglycan hydrolase-like protein with peptidoglycan-binding domain
MPEPITEHHLFQLQRFDEMLAHGPDYGKTMTQGALMGAVLSLFLGAPEQKGSPAHAVTYGLFGAAAAAGGVFLLFSVGKAVSQKSHEAIERVGQLPQAFPATGQPGQLVYNLDPRRDPLLDPVSRGRLYPAWLLLHWQNGDPQIISQVQRALGVPADGVVGSGTSAAIHAFQARSGLPTTGIMDRMTMEALNLG